MIGQDTPVSDELVQLSVGLPEDLAGMFGYTGEQQYVAVWHLIGGNDFLLDDGRLSHDIPHSGFYRWDREAGNELVERIAAAHGETTDNADHPTWPYRLTDLLRKVGYDIGSPDCDGNAALVFDLEEGRVFVGQYQQAMNFVRRFNDVPETHLDGGATIDLAEFEDFLNDFVKSSPDTSTDDRLDGG